MGTNHCGCITFEFQHTAELVTLVDMLFYILLHVDGMSSQVCREIRDCLHSACEILFILKMPSCVQEPVVPQILFV